MNKREELARIVAGLNLRRPLEPPAKPSAAAYAIVDQFLDCLMNPGPGAHRAFWGGLLESDDGGRLPPESFALGWKYALTHIKESRDD